MRFGEASFRRASHAAAEARGLPKRAMQAHSLETYESNLHSILRMATDANLCDGVCP